MKKIILSLIVIAGFLGFAFYYNKKQEPQVVNTTSSQSSEVINSTKTPTSAEGSASPTASQIKSTSGYKDGEYTGDAKDAIYGKIQVKLTIKNGKITDVVFLTYPNDVPHTREVSAMSLPILKQETIQAQTAKIDNVTGATQTTDGYIQSVQSALDKAKS